MVCVPAHKNGKMHKLETQACGGNGMVLVKILKINWGLDFLWSKIYDKGITLFPYTTLFRSRKSVV